MPAAPWEPSPVLSRAPSLGKEAGVLASLSDRGGWALEFWVYPEDLSLLICPLPAFQRGPRTLEASSA